MIKGFEPYKRLAYSITETAEALGCSRGLVYKLIEQGQLKVAKIGRLRRITAAEIERFLKESTDEDSSSM